MADTKLKVNSGLMSFEVEDHDGKLLGTVRFNPTDTGIIGRIENMVDFFNSDEVRSWLNENSTIADFSKFNELFKSKLDFAVGSPVSDVFFGAVEPICLTTENDFYFESVLCTIADALKEHTGQRIKKKIKKINAATAKYNK